MNLKSMSVGRLTTLREKVDATLQAKIADARRVIETELEKLSRFSATPGRGVAGSRRGGGVLPKYRNPENPSETWAGRGLRPRWLSAALKSGHKLEDFLIEGALARKAKPPTKRKAAAPKKANSPKVKSPMAKSRKAKSRKAVSPRAASPKAASSKAPRKPRTSPPAAPKVEEPEAAAQTTS